MKVKTYLTDTVDGVLMFGCLSVTVVDGDKNYLLDRNNDFKLWSKHIFKYYRCSSTNGVLKVTSNLVQRLLFAVVCLAGHLADAGVKIELCSNLP